MVYHTYRKYFSESLKKWKNHAGGDTYIPHLYQKSALP